jgi:hypothetical protein
MIERSRIYSSSPMVDVAATRMHSVRPGVLALTACGASLFLAHLPAHAQTTVGNITGRVMAQDGSVVQGAQVIVINEGTHATRSLQSSIDGSYGASELNPGLYTVMVQAPGYAPFKNLDVSLASQQTVRIDVTLKVGQVDSTVQVTEGAPVIQTEMPSIASTVSAVTLANTSSNLLSTSDATGDSGLLFYTELLPGGSQAGTSFNWSIYGSRRHQFELGALRQHGWSFPAAIWHGAGGAIFLCE